MHRLFSILLVTKVDLLSTTENWIGRKLKKAIYRCVRSCTVLKLREGGWQGPGAGGCWEVTSEMAAVKIMDWNAVNELRGKHMEDPMKEVSAMQYIAQDGPHENVLGTLNTYIPSCRSVRPGSFLDMLNGTEDFRNLWQDSGFAKFRM